MKILVAVKRVVDHNVRIRVKPDGSGVETDNVRMSMNPFCKHAVEAAVQLSEKGGVDEIVAVSIGPNAAKDVLLTAMAMGAHRSILIETDDRVEPLGVAKLLAKVVEDEKPDLVLLGKQAVDDDCNQTGQMLAGLLDWPQATFASAIDLQSRAAKVTREVDYGRAEVNVPLPAIITADLRLNTPRNTALPMVMKARQKPMAITPVADYGIDVSARIKIEKTTPPPERAGGETVDTVEELVGPIADAVAKSGAS